VCCVLQDPACTSYSQALLYYKGYHAIQTHRIAHALWCRGQKVMAVALQSRVSEVSWDSGFNYAPAVA
jgi:serine O-acetyltransferase